MKSKVAMYKVYSDDDGHNYLIPYGIWSLFSAKLDGFEKDGDQDGLEDYLSNFETLEGQEHVVILETDLAKAYG